MVVVATARGWALCDLAFHVLLSTVLCIHAVGSLTRRFLLRVRLGADLVILLANVARCLTSVTVLTEEAFYDYGPSRPEILRLVISTSILSSTRLPKSLDELGLRRDGLD